MSNSGGISNIFGSYFLIKPTHNENRGFKVSWKLHFFGLRITDVSSGAVRNDFVGHGRTFRTFNISQIIVFFCGSENLQMRNSKSFACFYIFFYFCSIIFLQIYGAIWVHNFSDILNYMLHHIAYSSPFENERFGNVIHNLFIIFI